MKRLSLLVLISYLISCAGSQSLNKKNQALNDRAEELQLVINMEPTNPANHVALGNVFSQLKKYDQAVEAYDKALQLRPGLNEALVQKGFVLWQKDDQKKALDAFKSVLYSPTGQTYSERIAKILGCPYQIRRVSDGRRDNAFPSCSADGRWILFQSNRDDNWEIYVMGSDGKNLRRLTRNQARDEGPVFAPDGQTYAFTSTRDDSIHVHLEDMTREIYLANLNDNEEKRLTDSPSDDWSPKFSPTGQQLMFLSDRSDTRDVPMSEKYNNIYELALQTGQIRQLTASMNGKALGDYDKQKKEFYFSAKEIGGYDIYVKKLSNKPAKKLLGTEGEDVGATLSHAGDKIVFFAKNGENYDIYFAHLDSLQIHRLTCNAAVDAYPVFSADDSRILFHSDRDGSYQIYAIELDKPMQGKELLEIVSELDKSAQAAQANNAKP